MLLKRFYDEGLAQASYLVGCAATGEALIVDPNRGVDQYIAAAEAEGLRITHVTETHIHADFVSGLRELASRTGATQLLSDAGPREWKYGFAGDPGVVLLRDGSTFRVGNIEIEARHTPGHTPEHLMFLATDTAAASEPIGAFTGDFVFVGDVGRPDLLEKAARLATESTGAARDLFQSLSRFKAFPDYLQIWPGHGAGSACGKGLSAVPQSTVGYERRFNWAMSLDDEATFVAAVLAGQPEPPAYFGRMKVINRVGPPILGRHPDPERVGETRLAELTGQAIVVDMRPAASFAAGHVPGTINIPWNKSFVTYAGSVLPDDVDVYLLGPDVGGVSAREGAWALTMIGYDRVRGYFGPDAIATWEASGRKLGTITQLSIPELVATHGIGMTLIDVRGRSEWDEGHIEGATHIPLPELPGRLAEVPMEGAVVLHCQGGGRSAIAASLLAARGRAKVSNLTGGYGAWAAAGHPVTRDPALAR